MSKETPPSDESVDTEVSVESTNEGPSLEQQLEKAKQDYLYLAADFDNYKKNAIKERSELVKFGNERLLRELLEVVDNLERALQAHSREESQEGLAAGVQMIFSELRTLLQKFGVKEVEAKGLPFDPNLHEALSSEPTDSVPPGHITQVFKKAYKYNDRLLRPAQVVVAVKPGAESQ